MELYPDVPQIIDDKRKAAETDREIERKLGLEYKTEDELTPEEKQQLEASTTPVKENLQKIVETKAYEPFGKAGVTDTTKFDGNLAEALK